MGKTLNVELLEPWQIEQFWPQIQDALLRLAHLWADKWTIDYFQQAAFNQHIQVWGVGYGTRMELMAFTQVVRYPANNFFQIMFVLGDEAWKEFSPPLIEAWHKFGATQNCRFWEAPHARVGWERRGFGKRTGIVLAGPIKQMVM